MHVVQINLPRAPENLAPSEMFERWPTLAAAAEAVAGAGVRVSVIQAAYRDERVARNGIDYRFIGPGRTAAQRDRCIAALLADLDADVAHVHGLEFARAAFAIAKLRSHLPILLQDHANRPPPWWRRRSWRRWYAAASAFVFTTLEQTQPFVATGLFPRHALLFEIPESSSRFAPGHRARARAETGLHGEPCVLWVGHLSAHKDPLSVLDGIARAAALLPDLHLWCAYATAPLLDEMERRIAGDPRLAGRVHLLGSVAHARVERLMQASDLFVSGSRGESTGYALLEALACGVVPVVTDIPAFRALTDAGRIGYLWPCGDAEQLAAGLVRAAALRPSRAEVREHFDAALSFAALGRRWAQAYARLCATPRRSAP